MKRWFGKWAPETATVDGKHRRLIDSVEIRTKSWAKEITNREAYLWFKESATPHPMAGEVKVPGAIRIIIDDTNSLAIHHSECTRP